MTKNIIITILTVAFMIAIGVIIFSSGDFPMKLVWLVVSFFLTVVSAYRKTKQKERDRRKEDQASFPERFMNDDNPIL